MKSSSWVQYLYIHTLQLGFQVTAVLVNSHPLRTISKGLHSPHVSPVHVIEVCIVCMHKYLPFTSAHLPGIDSENYHQQSHGQNQSRDRPQHHCAHGCSGPNRAGLLCCRWSCRNYPTCLLGALVAARWGAPSVIQAPYPRWLARHNSNLRHTFTD